MEKKIDLSKLAERWPSSLVARQEVKAFTGGAVSDRYLANLDRQRAGPDCRFKIGRKVVYPVASLVKWLESRSTGQNE